MSLQRVYVTAETRAVIGLAGGVRVDGLVDASRGAFGDEFLQLDGPDGGHGHKRWENVRPHDAVVELAVIVARK